MLRPPLMPTSIGWPPGVPRPSKSVDAITNESERGAAVAVDAERHRLVVEHPARRALVGEAGRSVPVEDQAESADRRRLGRHVGQPGHDDRRTADALGEVHDPVAPSAGAVLGDLESEQVAVLAGRHRARRVEERVVVRGVLLRPAGRRCDRHGAGRRGARVAAATPGSARSALAATSVTREMFLMASVYAAALKVA